MSWYVLQCKSGQERVFQNACIRHLSSYALENAFIFQCERLWKTNGTWMRVYKDMFPGYVFLQSSHPKILYSEIRKYRGYLRVMEENGYLLSVYADEEEYLRSLCGERHVLSLSYGYKDRKNGISYIVEGPLKNRQSQIVKFDWHKRFAQVEVSLNRRCAVIWAGIDISDQAV